MRLITVASAFFALAFASACSGPPKVPASSSPRIATEAPPPAPPPPIIFNPDTPTSSELDIPEFLPSQAAGPKPPSQTVAFLRPISGSDSFISVIGTYSASVRNRTLEDDVWLPGARHYFAGTVWLRAKGRVYMFEGDPEKPLGFGIHADRGYVFLGGRGVVTLPGAKRVQLDGPPAVLPVPRNINAEKANGFTRDGPD